MFESISVDFHVDLSLCRHSILQYSATPFNISNQYWYISIFNISNQYECSSKFICPLAGLPGRKGICWAKLGFNLWLLDICLSFIRQSSLSLSISNIGTLLNEFYGSSCVNRRIHNLVSACSWRNFSLNKKTILLCNNLERV